MNRWYNIYIYLSFLYLYLSIDLSINIHTYIHILTGAERREWMGMGVAGMIIHDYCGSFPHSRSEAPVSIDGGMNHSQSWVIWGGGIFARIFTKH